MDYWNLYKDVWNFHKKFSQILDTVEYWENVCSEGRKISKEYGECKFVIELVLAVINELTRKAKEMRESAGTQIPDGTAKKVG